MATTGKEFITNFRNAKLNPFSNPALLTRNDINTRNRIERSREDDLFAKEIAAQNAEVNNQIKATAPLRRAIGEASSGRVLVDKSIYNEKALNRILDAVNAMKERTGGALLPGYTVIADKNLGVGVRGKAQSQTIWSNKFFPGLKWQTPGDIYGSENSPYRVYLKNANATEFNDFLAKEANDNHWTVENLNEDDVESSTHAHELAHTAYFDVLKKTQNPMLTINPQERAKREEFRQTHPSLQEIFDIAARNTGFDTVQDAAASISDYALEDAEYDNEKGGLSEKSNWSPSYRRLSELFAEAYTDFIYNGDNASKYSKELIKQYLNYVNEYNKTFNDNKIVLNKDLVPIDIGQNNFVNNLRRSK